RGKKEGGKANRNEALYHRVSIVGNYILAAAATATTAASGAGVIGESQGAPTIGSWLLPRTNIERVSCSSRPYLSLHYKDRWHVAVAFKTIRCVFVRSARLMFHPLGQLGEPISGRCSAADG